MDDNLTGHSNQAPTSHVVIPPPVTSSSSPNMPPAPEYHSSTPPTPVEPSQPQEKRGRRINKKMAILAIAVLLIVALPLTIFLVQRQQNSQNQAAGSLLDSTVIAIFNGQKIYGKDIRLVAMEQYAPSAIDSRALKISLQTLLERKVLDKEKATRNISVSRSEIAVKREQDDLTEKQAYYEVLKDKVTLLNTKNWQVYSIAFWVPPAIEQTGLNAIEKQTVNQVLSDGLLALNDAETRLVSEEAINIAQDLIVKYPSLSGYLGVNGTLVGADSQDNLALFQSPRVYSYEPKNVGQPLFDAIYSMNQVGQIVKVVPQDGGVGAVIKLSATDTDSAFNTYNSWLADKLKSQSSIVYSL